MQPKQDDTEQYKIVLIGDSTVGKTAIINRFSTNEFYETSLTVGVDFRFKCIDIDGIPMKLQIWDTAGQERFQSISKSYYRGADGIIIVYAIDDTRTFQNVRKWLADIGNTNTSGTTTSVVKYLVGNKADLMEIRAIDERTGKSEADEFKIKFMETSAKTSMNVDELFVSIARDIRQNKSSLPKQPEPTIDLDKKTTTKSGCC